MSVEKSILISFRYNFEGVLVIEIKNKKPYGVRKLENGMTYAHTLLVLAFFYCLRFEIW